MKKIYLDYAATTPVDPRVSQKMLQYLDAESAFGNAASNHSFGRVAKEAIEEARAQVAALIGAEAREIIFTSGATESDNLAIKGAAYLHQRKGKHIITMQTEHKAVLDSCLQLQKEGYRVSFLAPQKNGLLDLDELQAALRPDTILVSIMHINNETGVMQEMQKIAELTAQRGILFHVDAAQNTGKVALDVNEVGIDLISLSAHKIYGPKGIGALYLRKKPRVRVHALLHGGGHEQGMRSGTLATHQIVGMGEAVKIAKENYQKEYDHILKLNKQLIEGLQQFSFIKLNTNPGLTYPGIVNFRFVGLLADAILQQMPHIAISTASACQAQSAETSYVLRAMGLEEEAIKASVRVSFGRFTRVEDIEELVRAITQLSEAK